QAELQTLRRRPAPSEHSAAERHAIDLAHAERKLQAAEERWHTRLKPSVQTPEIGFIAEEVNEVEPFLVAPESGDMPMALMYGQFTALLAKAMQELDLRLSALEG